ncbi:uncharacterized protein [Arachis hypogaea]|uniref:uncharacterized protein isoform X5 n=1 Tax=Arachis hypogaea TaxID=3818 RepID=UPI003B212E3D
MPKKICAFGSAFMKVPTLAIPGIKLGGIGNMRGYDKRAIGPVRSCPLPLGRSEHRRTGLGCNDHFDRSEYISFVCSTYLPPLTCLG